MEQVTLLKDRTGKQRLVYKEDASIGNRDGSIEAEGD
jgi:hypothetical protein